jgi:hypothetical protein
MLKGILPNVTSLRKYQLDLFVQLCESIRYGNLRLFSQTLEAHEKTFLAKFIYLPVERLHYIVYRRLFKNT